MGSSHARREKRLLFGPSKGEQHLAVWYSLRWGDYKRVWICPQFVPSKESSLYKLASERAERSLLPRRRKSRRGQRVGGSRSRGGNPRSPTPIRPSKAKTSRVSRRNDRASAWVEKRSEFFFEKISSIPKISRGDQYALKGLTRWKKCFAGFSSQVRKLGFSPITFRNFRGLCHADLPWAGCPDIRVSMSSVVLSDFVDGSNIIVRRSTDVPPPMVLTGGFLFGKKTPSIGFCRQCGYRHVPGDPCRKSTPPLPRRRRRGK